MIDKLLSISRRAYYFLAVLIFLILLGCTIYYWIDIGYLNPWWHLHEYNSFFTNMPEHLTNEQMKNYETVERARNLLKNNINDLNIFLLMSALILPIARVIHLSLHWIIWGKLK